MSDQALEQSQDLSIEDRMAQLLSQEDAPVVEEPENEQETEVEAETESTQAEEGDEQAEGEAETEEGGLVEFEFDGNVYEVPVELKKILEDKTSSGMMHADYTRKTQEVAEQRKQVEALQQNLQVQAQVQQQFINEYAQLVSIDNMIQQYNSVDWNQLYESDPTEFVRMKEAVRDLKDSRVNLASQLTQKQQQQLQQQEQARIQAIQEGQTILAREIPNWNTELAKDLSTFIVDKYGMTADEVATIVDPRHVKIIYDAYQFNKQKEKVNVANKKVVNLPKVTKPGSNVNKQTVQQSKVSDAMKAHKKSGSVESAANAFLARFS